MKSTSSIHSTRRLLGIVSEDYHLQSASTYRNGEKVFIEISIEFKGYLLQKVKKLGLIREKT